MTIDDCILQNQEKIIFALRKLYSSYDYKPYRMSKFEEYDLYAKNKDFLVSDNVITFTDTDGKLMALKPDVTLSIIKNCNDDEKSIQKVFYNENVYRVSKGTDSFKEIMQTGVECFGNIGTNDIYEVLSLAAESLKTLSEDALLSVSDINIIEELMNKLNLSSEKKGELYTAIDEKNLNAIYRICEDSSDKHAFEYLIKILSLHGTVSELYSEAKSLFEYTYPEFFQILSNINESKYAEMTYIDFSVTGDINYYNGIIFKGFIKGVPVYVLSGGQYDKLMHRLGRKANAIGFAVYTDVLDRIDLCETGKDKESDNYVNIALPKGRLGEKVYGMLEQAGYECPSLLDPGRKLIFENPEKGVRYFWVKPSDVAIYVERGAADIGVVGKDILLEYEPDVYELLDLKKGKCRMAVAAPKTYEDDPSRTLIVATKFANIAKKYYRSLGRDIDIIHLNGSIEIAPILGLSDVIVDIVETGTTLKENNLEVVENIVPISARFIANKSSYKYKAKVIREMTDKLSEVVEGLE